ncbi:hypothetical protein AVEN_2075-1 [Araneus ventricosus]|uniref:Uncharacterized protein n=1 Tax=Araneus ventricosus TaxID=182803 RepID=A0A4Y2TZU6_ARAVE|nr:hypothetical protein AVEN_2075-1 [Araneus ventricosus]
MREQQKTPNLNVVVTEVRNQKKKEASAVLRPSSDTLWVFLDENHLLLLPSRKGWLSHCRRRKEQMVIEGRFRKRSRRTSHTFKDSATELVRKNLRTPRCFVGTHRNQSLRPEYVFELINRMRRYEDLAVEQMCGGGPG